ncbi:homoserine dehydrogenase [Occultella glacieicola]|uniref:Homoserine dehydrogenase n=1 Tax=Occultella glacieicola TaxID=2518684 RepID=A0ABY2E608_9MICO|nr:homoserine dehydrogenase [Occultella glacieicola]TDE96037.1 homoserine dehydrogenase [Occultella glacieicola]
MNDVPAPLRVAVLGCGVVGTEVVRRLLEHTAEFSARTGADLELSGIAVRTLTTPRDPVVPTDLLTDDAAGLVAGADLLVEVMGGIEPARTLILDALRAGVSVITANKALLAQHGPELYEAADAAHVDLFYEAAVAGAVPVVRGVRESLAGDRINRILGIVNGTTNYILDEMTTNELDFGAALAQAQELGYAEADPTADVEGLDAAAKAAILASLAFHSRIALADVSVQGITQITPADIASAAQTGHVIKLLAVAEQRRDGAGQGGGVAVRVYPALVPAEHPLGNVRGPFNAVLVEAEAAGTLMFYGAGAGGAATSSAVLGDLVAAARHRVSGGKSPSESRYADLTRLGADEIRTRYQIRMEITDRPGVLAEVATAVAEHGVSFETVRQQGQSGGPAELVIGTHEASESALAATLTALDTLDVVPRISSVLRVEGI